MHPPQFALIYFAKKERLDEFTKKSNNAGHDSPFEGSAPKDRVQPIDALQQNREE
jgi:hypothetical protein